MPKHQQDTNSIGGAPFLLSLFCLLLLSVLNCTLLPFLWNESARDNFLQFVIGGIFGAFAVGIFIRGHTSVFFHEFKHSLLSGLAGNKAKGMKIQRDSGHFEYEYTEETAYYNSLIALAPYFFPLCTLISLPIAILSFQNSHLLGVIVVGIGYGADLMMGLRDISPHQSDIYKIKGGYLVAIAYLTAMHLTILTFLLSWIFQGWLGVKFLFYGLFQLVKNLIAYYKTVERPV